MVAAQTEAFALIISDKGRRKHLQNPEAFNVEAPSRKTPKLPFRSDPSCWSPLADKKYPAPNCSFCGLPAQGGNFTDMDSGYPIGQVTGTVEFSCGCDGRKVFSIRVENIGQWQLFREVSPGVFRVRKRTQAERIKEVTDNARS